MNIIFCSDDLDRRKPDEAYAAEAAALERVGGQHFLVNFDALVNDGDALKAVRRLPEQAEPGLAMYRGWMLKPAAYKTVAMPALATGYGHLSMEQFAAGFTQAMEAGDWAPIERVVVVVRKEEDAEIIRRALARKRQE